MTVRVDIGGLIQRAVRLRATARQVSALKQRAVGTLRRRMPVAARRDIQQEYAISASRVNEGVRTTNIDGGIVIQGSGRGVGLIQFGARQTRKGVTYLVRRGKRELQEGAFIAKVRGKPHVFVRAKSGGKRVARLPIERQFRLSIAQMLRRPDRRDRIGKAAEEIMAAEVERLIRTLR